MSMTRKGWLRIGVYGTVGVGILVFLLHPYSRQTVFGPKVRGMPFCYWQDGFRRQADPVAYRDSLATKVLEWLGVAKRQPMLLSLGGDDELRLLLSLADDPQPRVREQVADHLGVSLPSDERVMALRRMLDDPDAKVRAAAAITLGTIRPESVAALPRLVELLADADAGCRVQAARAVWRLDQKKHREVVPVLQQALMDGNPIIRDNAVHVLHELGTDASEAFPEIAACATSDPHMIVRAAALETLGAFGRPAIPILVKALGEPSPFPRRGTAYALGKVGPDAKETVPALRALLSDSSEDVRERVREALRCIDPQQFPAPKTEPQ